MTILRIAAMLLAFVAAAHAQTVNRVNVPAGLATPTGASFSVQFPVPYSDMDIVQGDDPTPIRMVTGVTGDRVRFSASQFDMRPDYELQPVEDFMNHLKEKSGADLSDVHHERAGDIETLSFTLIDAAGGGNFFRVIRHPETQYVLLIQFHAAQRDQAAAMKDGFFASFKTAGQ